MFQFIKHLKPARVIKIKMLYIFMSAKPACPTGSNTVQQNLTAACSYTMFTMFHHNTSEWAWSSEVSCAEAAVAASVASKAMQIMEQKG